jgi:serine/threonine protein kinase
MNFNAAKRQPSVEGKILMKRKATEEQTPAVGPTIEFDHSIDVNVGQTLSDFKILSELGKGSYGTVFKAQSLINMKEYVIKKINIKHLKPKHQREAQKEVQILKRVQHSNIIRYYSSFTEEDCLYIIMEYAEGGDLQMVYR